MNDNGQRLIELCHQFDLRITNGYYKHKEIHKYTWARPSQNQKSIIDYVIVKQKTGLKISDTRVKRGAECGSDHFLLLSKIYLPYRTSGTAKDNTQEKHQAEKPINYNIESLTNDSTKFLYQMRLATKLANVQDGTPEQMYTAVTSEIHEAVFEALGIRTFANRQSRKNCPWWNEDLQQHVDQKKQAYQKWLVTRTQEDRAGYQVKRRIVTQETKRAQNEYWSEVCETIDRSMGNTRANKAWKVIKSLRTNNIEKGGISLISMPQWVQHYKNLLTEDRVQFADTSESATEDMNEVPIITAKEVSESKNGKAPGPGGINIELIKAGPAILTELLTIIFNKCLQGAEPPSDWKKAAISSLFKKGERTDCNNYRGISVLSTVARIYGRVLKLRMEREFDESEEQNGFRAGRSCTDGVFTLKNLIEKRVERGREVHLVFVDLQKAYDTVPLNKLWPAMEKNRISSAYINAVRKFYCGCKSYIRVGRNISEEFSVSKGLRQGCSIAPLLFKIYIEEALKKWKRRCSGMGLPIGDLILYTLFFADDQVLITGDRDDASYMLRALRKEFEEFGLVVNMKKTEYMSVGCDDHSDLDIGMGTTIKHCTKFKYLGVTLSSNGKSDDDISNKIGQGKRIIRQLNSLLWSDRITKRTKHMMYNAIFESVCTYGSETWELTKRNKDRLLALEMDYWRRSNRTSRLEHVRNDYIREQMQVNGTILETIESKRLLWFGHLQRMDDSRIPKRIWDWVPTERRKRGRPARAWRDDVQEAMQKRNLRVEDWWNRSLWKSSSGKRH